MLLEERYLALYARFNTAGTVDETYEVTLDELAGTLYCTRRNVKLIVRRLEDEGMISWQAGLGRGHRSRIAFRIEEESVLFELAVKQASKGEYKTAFELLDQYGGHSGAKMRFMDWLSSQFGYQQEKDVQTERDILRLPVYRPVLTLDPAMVFYAFDAHLIRQLFDRLVRYDPETERLVPGIAHHWKSDREGKVWTFYLRKGVRFQHGREVTADDVVFSMERQKEGKPNSWMLRSVERIESEGPRVIRFTLGKPNFLLPRFMCASSMSIIPRELATQNEDYWRLPVGSGPFRLTHWSSGRFAMEANTDFHEGRPHLDVIELVILPADLPIASRPANWEQLIMEHDSIEKQPDPGWLKMERICPGCSLLCWNMRKAGPQRHPSFRKAIDRLIDREGMIASLGGDRGLPAAGFRVEARAETEIRSPDPKQVRALLAEADYQGERITLNTYFIHEKDARWIKERCAEYGIPVQIQLETWESISDYASLAAGDCVLYGVTFGEDEVDELEVYEQSRGFMQAHLHPEVRGWMTNQIDEALSKPLPGERRQVLRGIEQYLRDEAYVLFLVHKKLTSYFNPAVKGVSFNSLGWIDFQHVWLEP
ncbi:MarR-like DNA-binding transcriptional regulator SgrR of sgrS sRNA [Paenibacillus phyllosphaerae]|uniref:MarR-like DNA-binding transcriptional regulator SgrR of sgrS sRNA n=1 Tax=Paenibacillus phyllosphaerae TaxID=274593 RepID=A0A7W5B6S0_9BACL|nr:SgrR family transcriptional regulator [Paenibacillus phyllosphaerae]MBB3114756.1 MarR-like DNA-binding transcriptional regulator SgrR of sgrS sRNA [Paenibacillus phyllosphaerae]